MILQLGINESDIDDLNSDTLLLCYNSAAHIIQFTEHTFIEAVFEMAAVLRFFVITATDTTIYFFRKMRNIIQLFRYIWQTQKLMQPGPYSLSVQRLVVQGWQQVPGELFLLRELPISP